jgi:hypothetical protein
VCFTVAKETKSQKPKKRENRVGTESKGGGGGLLTIEGSTDWNPQTRDGEEMRAGVEAGEDLRGLEKPLRIHGEILVWTGVWHRTPYTVSLQEYPIAHCDIGRAECKYANTGGPFSGLPPQDM